MQFKSTYQEFDQLIMSQTYRLRDEQMQSKYTSDVFISTLDGIYMKSICNSVAIYVNRSRVESMDHKLDLHIER